MGALADEDPFDKLDDFLISKGWATPKKEYDPALIPTAADLGDRALNPEFAKLKERIDRDISVFDIYDRFMPGHKARAHPKPGQRESILFSCPSPDHPDTHPSSWTNIDGLWYCGACGARGDKYTIAALGLGLDLKRDFKEVVTYIADAFGVPYDLSPRPESYETPVKSPEPVETSDSAVDPITITTKTTPDLDDRAPADARALFLPDPTVPTLDYTKLYPPDTFIYTMMHAIEYDDVPYEYQHFQAIQAVGLATGRDAYFVDIPHVYPNFFILLYGPTGGGKSRSMYYVQSVLEEALPYDYSDPESKGVAMIPLPGSPEALVDSFSVPILDGDGKIIGYGSMRGLVKSDEFSVFIARGDRSAGLKGQLTEMFDRADIKIKSRGAGTVEAHGVFCCVITSTQPAAIAEIIKHHDVHSGFMNRFFPVTPSPRPQLHIRRHGFDPGRAVEQLRAIRAWAARGRALAFDEPADRLFRDFFHDELAPIKHDPAGALLIRQDLYLKKLMIVIAANEKNTVIDKSVVERAISFYPYMRHSFNELAGGITLNKDEEMIEWIIRGIQRYVDRTGEPPTAKQLRESCGLPKRFTNFDLVRGLSTLEKLGRVRRMARKATGSGRPTERFQLSELVSDDD